MKQLLTHVHKVQKHMIVKIQIMYTKFLCQKGFENIEQWIE